MPPWSSMPGNAPPSIVSPKLAALRDGDVPVQLIFFDCGDDVLQRRFSETRRPHPMADLSDTLVEAIANERKALQPLRDVADRIIDTSRYTPHELRSFLSNAYGEAPGANRLNVNVVSFGFKYGTPTQADLLFDVRFLPNPYFVEGLRELDGRTDEVRRYLEDVELTGDFMRRLQSFLDFLVPHYAAEGKTYLTVALGCTGGKHRSVALAVKLGHYLAERQVPSSVSHRDLGRE